MLALKNAETCWALESKELDLKLLHEVHLLAPKKLEMNWEKLLAQKKKLSPVEICLMVLNL